ncbi:MAG: V-type ATP synthase subunit I, partial [Spirochaetales bacterium]|nr:V-type ATP synthase subunit I [Spirochaetales bacterium]
MIVPMKKVSVVTLKALEQATLTGLGELGVLHVFTDSVETDRAEHLRSQLGAVDHALALIPPDETAKRSHPSGDEAVDAALTIAERCQQLADEESQLADERERLMREAERLAPWGDVDPAMFTVLDEGGVRAGLYEVTAEAADVLVERLPNAIEVSRSKTHVRVVGIAVGEETLPDDIAPIALPDRSTAEITTRRDEIDARVADIAAELRSLATERPVVLAAREQLMSDIEFATVRASMDSDRELSWITGFAPHDIVDDVRSAAQTNGWGVVVRDPDENEQVPTKTRNPKPIGIIKPVFNLLGTVPGYREMDISFFFLTFFIVFFAMIIGDGGYGLILLGGTVFSALRGLGRGKPIGTGTVLMLVLSAATVVWGAITGNWFGYAPFNDLPFLRDLVIPSISIDNDASAELIQYVCFVIGTVHLSIAHIWNFLREIRRKPHIAAIAQLGWLSMVLGLYYLVLQLVLDPSLYPMPEYALYMIAGGLAA